MCMTLANNYQNRFKEISSDWVLQPKLIRTKFPYKDIRVKGKGLRTKSSVAQDPERAFKRHVYNKARKWRLCVFF